MIQSKYLQDLQNKHQFQGKSNDCAAISIAMAANVYKGTEVDGYELGQEVNGFVWKGIFPLLRRIPDNAMMPWGMTDAAKDLGLKARWKMFQKPEGLMDKIDQDLILLPVIGRWKPLWAHVMPLVAYDEEKGWGFINPAKKKSAPFYLANEKFLKEWRWSLNMLIEIENV